LKQQISEKLLVGVFRIVTLVESKRDIPKRKEKKMFVASRSISGKASELFLCTIKRDSNGNNQILNK